MSRAGNWPERAAVDRAEGEAVRPAPEEPDGLREVQPCGLAPRGRGFPSGRYALNTLP
jgi:hypothetical protein